MVEVWTIIADNIAAERRERERDARNQARAAKDAERRTRAAARAAELRAAADAARAATESRKQAQREAAREFQRRMAEARKIRATDAARIDRNWRAKRGDMQDPATLEARGYPRMAATYRRLRALGLHSKTPAENAVDSG